MKVVGLVVRPLCKQVCSGLGHRTEGAIESVGVKVPNDGESERILLLRIKNSSASFLDDQNNSSARGQGSRCCCDGWLVTARLRMGAGEDHSEYLDVASGSCVSRCSERQS